MNLFFFNLQMTSNALNWMFNSVIWVYTICIKNVLYTLYREGPALHGYGFWQGHSDNFICSSLTRYDGQQSTTQFGHYESLWRHRLTATSTTSASSISASASSISASASSVSASAFTTQDINFWELHSESCRHIIETDFRQYEISLLILMYAWIMYHVLRKALQLIWSVSSECVSCKCWLCRWILRIGLYCNCLNYCTDKYNRRHNHSFCIRCKLLRCRSCKHAHQKKNLKIHKIE